MPTQMVIAARSERIRQRLLQCFETKKGMHVESSEPNLIRVRTTWGSKYPWIITRIEMVEENSRTKVTVDLSFKRVCAILGTLLAAAIAFIWVLPTTIEWEHVFFSMLLSALALTTWAYDVYKARGELLGDIRGVLNSLDKEDQSSNVRSGAATGADG
jgi:hypothetical protein